MERRLLEFHSVADVFPLMSGAQKEGFYRSIAQDGVVRPLVMYEGRILDGRNRYLAAVEAGIPLEDIPFRDFGSEVTDGDRPVDFVIRSNLHRRHLTDDQREMVAARIADLPRHRPRRPPGAPTTESDFAAPSKTRDRAAKLLNVKPRGVKRARTIVRTGIPPLQEFVDEGRVSVRTGAEVAALPAQVQQQLVEGGPERVVQKVKELRQAREQSKLPKQSNPALAVPLAIAPGATCSLVLDGSPIVAVWTDKVPASWTNGEPLLFLKLPSSPAIPSGAVGPLEASAIYDELAQPYPGELRSRPVVTDTPDEPRVAGRRRRLRVDPPLDHRHALRELREGRRRRPFEDPIVAADAFEESGPGENGDALAGHRHGAEHELLGEPKRWVGDHPVVRARLVGVGQELPHRGIAVAVPGQPESREERPTILRRGSGCCRRAMPGRVSPMPPRRSARCQPSKASPP